MRHFAVLLVVLAAGAPSLGWAGDTRWSLQSAFGERGRGRNELREPVDVALTRDGSLAVLDLKREAVVLFSRAGNWVRTLGGDRGEGQVEFRRPAALATDDEDRFWVVDQGNHRLVVFDEEGKVLLTVGSLGSHEGRFRRPSDLTFDRRGRVYVADSGNERIQVFSREGVFLSSWERRTGGRRDHLGVPRSLAYSDQAKGGIWVVNEGSALVERFDLEGEWEESLEMPNQISGDIDLVALEIEPAFYRMFLSDAAGNRVLVLDRRGALLDEVVGPETDPMKPMGLVVNRGLDLYVAETLGARVLKYAKR